MKNFEKNNPKGDQDVDLKVHLYFVIYAFIEQ